MDNNNLDMKRTLLISQILLAIVGACGEGNSDNTPLEKITFESGMFSIEDFVNTGFKVSQEYDVSELEDSLAVLFGFWTNDSNNSTVLDYEVRIYPSQQLALDKGVKYVEEVIGKDAILSESLSSWKEGIQHRRTRTGRGMSGSEANTIRAKYLDYIVFGNTMILCTGLDLTDARQNCYDLANSLNK